MSLKDVSSEQLEEVAVYLDKHSDGHGSGNEEEFWRLLIKELKRATPASGGKKIRYSMVEVEDFATELLKNRRPSLKLLHDLQGKKLSLDVFVSCLEKIGCAGAQNVFRTAAPPEITQHPASQNLRSGDQIVLTCRAECQPPAQYLWFRGQTPIANSRSNALIIRNANSGDSGWYVCRANNPNINDPTKSVFSKWAEVEVVGSTVVTQETQPPTITVHPAHATVCVGGRAELECQAEGERLVYDWYKDGKQFRENQRHGKLIFDPVTPEHLGEYYCVVVNDVGRVESSCARLSDGPPIVVTEQPKDCRDRVGKGITLRCIAEGPPGKTLVYQWFQKQPGRNSEDKKIGTDNFVCYARLFFTPRLEYKIYCRVSLEEDPGVRVQSEMATVTVDSIWITQQPLSIDCYIGDRASLFCRAEGCPEGCQEDQKIRYMWLRSDTRGGKKQELVLTCDTGVLPFERLVQKHWGYYVCQAQNSYQHVQSKEVYVKVSAPPADGSRARDHAAPMIRFTKLPWSQVVPLGGRFRLLCEAHSTADEPLHYQWYFNGLPQDGETDSQLIRERVLQSNIGSYFCEVRTHEGLARSITSTARIEQAPPPCEKNHQEMSGEQMNQEEAERFLITAKEERYAREKVALLIGNQRYQSKGMIELSSPENDTRELAEKLRALNFKVFSFVDLNFRDMMDALEVFYGMLTLSGIYALFYYSGHGFSHGGVTYLMPVDATLPPKCDLNIAADDITAHMQNKKSRAVKILDCCRTSDREDIESPTLSRTRSLGYSNILEITSCPTDHASYEHREEPNSTFNVALRDALDERKKMTEVFEQILDNMRTAPQSLNGKPYQRPVLYNSLADPKITLHDPVMLDDPAAEEKLYEIGRKWEQAHVLPDPVLLPDEMGGLLSVKLNFSADFSNVLVVRIILIPMGGCTSAKVDVDTQFLEGQSLRGEFYLQQSSPPDHPTHTMATLKVANLQKLEGKLKLCLKVSVTEPGRGEKEGTVVHELEQIPLFANVHLPN